MKDISIILSNEQIDELKSLLGCSQTEKTKIEKGKTYKCIKNNPIIDNDDWTIGKEYLAIDNNTIRDDGNWIRKVYNYPEIFVEQINYTSEDVKYFYDKLFKVLNIQVTDEIQKQINQLIQDQEIIYVPDNILTKHKAIINQKHIIVWSSPGQTYEIFYNEDKPSTHQQFKLVKCKRNELQPGDVAFRTYQENKMEEQISELWRYCLILHEIKNKYYIAWNRGEDGDIYRGYSNWNQWYKVVQV